MSEFNKTLLKTIFAFKRNFTKGQFPQKKTFDGIEVAPFKYSASAAVSISADFELNWAFRALNLRDRDNKGIMERQNFPYIIHLLEDNAIPITWATVGHLFLSSCERDERGYAHPEMPRMFFNEKWKGDWYIHDPCSDFRKDPLWYAPDLIEQIIKSNVPHEIGTHSFSHIDFSSKYITKELIRREIEECVVAMEPFGVRPLSFVYPHNHIEYSCLDMLANLNIIAVRHRDKKVRLSYPERTTSGVYKIYESMNLRTPRYYDYLYKAMIFIKEAKKRHAVYHLWFHPSDPSEVFKRELCRIVEYICQERQEGTIWVATMSELATYCEARENITLKIKRKHNKITIFIESLYDIQRYGSTDLSLVIPANEFPQHVLLDKGYDTKEVKKKDILKHKLQHQLVINFPITAKSLTIIF